jgi:hypothetical protein
VTSGARDVGHVFIDQVAVRIDVTTEHPVRSVPSAEVER